MLLLLLLLKLAAAAAAVQNTSPLDQSLHPAAGRHLLNPAVRQILVNPRVIWRRRLLNPGVRLLRFLRRRHTPSDRKRHGMARECRAGSRDEIAAAGGCQAPTVP
jgi:hypothetical protein